MQVILTCATLAVCSFWGLIYSNIMTSGEIGADKTMYVVAIIAIWFPLCLWTLKKSGDRYRVYFFSVVGSFFGALLLGFIIGVLELKMGSHNLRDTPPNYLATETMVFVWLSFVPILGTVTWRMKPTTGLTST